MTDGFSLRESSLVSFEPELSNRMWCGSSVTSLDSTLMVFISLLPAIRNSLVFEPAFGASDVIPAAYPSSVTFFLLMLSTS